MDPATIAIIVAGAIGIIGGGIPLGKAIYDRVKKGGFNLGTIKSIWGDYGDDLTDMFGEVEDLIDQTKDLSKAIDEDEAVLDRINANKALRNAVIEAAQEYGPEAVQDLVDYLDNGVPARFERISGTKVDKISRIKEAQRDKLSKKDAYNKVLGNSGKMARQAVGMLTKILPAVTKLKK